MTEDQQAIIDAIQADIDTLDDKANGIWTTLKTSVLTIEQREHLRDELSALDSEIGMKQLIAHVPTAGEGKISRLLGNLKKLAGKDKLDWQPDERYLASRLKTLEQVNAWREEYGLPPLDRLPRATVGDASDCVIQRALVQGADGVFEQVSVNDGDRIQVTFTDEAWDNMTPAQRAYAHGFDLAQEESYFKGRSDEILDTFTEGGSRYHDRHELNIARGKTTHEARAAMSTLIGSFDALGMPDLADGDNLAAGIQSAHDSGEDEKFHRLAAEALRRGWNITITINDDERPVTEEMHRLPVDRIDIDRGDDDE